jgi:bifunctional non-homologous end joining protein LigD
MLAVPWPGPFVDEAWTFELKWDGVRALLHWDGAQAVLRSRTGGDVSDRYPELTGFTAPRPLVLDGEIVAFDDAGRPSFERLQRRMNLQSARHVAEAAGRVPISYAVFDLLHLDEPVTGRSLVERRGLLDSVELPEPMTRSAVVETDPTALWDLVARRGIEGIVGKRRVSTYQPGRRSHDWRKITSFRQVRAVVGGFTAGEGGRSAAFGSLLLGLWQGSGLRYVGAVGSGFDDAALRAIRAALDEMVVERSPFVDPPAGGTPVTWVAPRLVALVQFKEWTAAGRLRGPSFKGFTDDAVAAVTWEAEGPGAPG